MIRKSSLEEFNDLVAENTPSPGGGTVSIYTASLATSLLKMTSTYIFKDENDLHSELDEIREELLVLSQQDMEAFPKVLQAYKIDKNSPNRLTEINKALVGCIEVPFKAINKINRAIRIANDIGKNSSAQIVADVSISLELLKASREAQKILIEENLSYIKDEKVVEEVRRKVEGIL